MKKLIIAALGLSLLASTTVFAQEAATPPPPPPAGADTAAPQPNAGAPGARPGDEAGPRGDARRGPPERGPRDEARNGPKGPDGPPPPPPPSKAAEFRFKRGSLEVKVRCSELEPIKPCADAADQLMDKFATLPTPGLMPGRGDSPEPPVAGSPTGSEGAAPAQQP